MSSEAQKISHCLAFLESQKAKFYELLNAGDIEAALPKRSKGGTGTDIVPDQQERLNICKQAAKLKAKGLSWEQVAKGTPYEGHSDALAHQCTRLGLHDRKVVAKQRKAERAKIDEEARRINAEALKIGNLKKALDGAAITVHQYHSARARLSLPSIPRAKS